MAPTESSQLLSPSTTSLIQDEYGNPKLHVDKLPDIKTLIVTGGAILENRGSTARDHLANERTYLAWMRTGLALVGASLGLLKWDTANKNNLEGYLVGVMGIVVLATATQRYFRNMQHLERGVFEPNVRGILSINVVVVAAIVAAFCLQFHHQQQQQQQVSHP